MAKINLEEGDLVLCTVDRIIGTVVVVKIEGLPENVEGNIVTSEIAPGRIRNLRDYVVPKKKIVCKILRIAQNGNIDLSLRRVSQKETKEVMERYGEEKSYVSILRSILGQDSEAICKKIEENSSIYDFLNQARENPKTLENLVGKENSKRILDILNAQKKKTFESKIEISLSTTNSNGIELIKDILTNVKQAKISYIAAGRYSIQVEDSDPKTSGNKLRQALLQIEEQAKKSKIEFDVKEK